MSLTAFINEAKAAHTKENINKIRTVCLSLREELSDDDSSDDGQPSDDDSSDEENKKYNYTDYGLWAKVTENVYITDEIMQAFPDIPWDFYFLSYNPYLTWDLVKTKINKECCNLLMQKACSLSCLPHHRTRP